VGRLAASAVAREKLPHGASSAWQGLPRPVIPGVTVAACVLPLSFAGRTRSAFESPITMLSLFSPRRWRFVWSPAVDFSHGRVALALATFRGR
jgi:hypothetical protein